MALLSQCVSFLAKPPFFRSDTGRALPQGASPMVWAFYTFAHTRPLWPTQTTSGSEVWKYPTNVFVRKPFKV
eukprot:926525-Pelagomonas_calceolata.AAC.4